MLFIMYVTLCNQAENKDCQVHIWETLDRGGALLNDLMGAPPPPPKGTP